MFLIYEKLQYSIRSWNLFFLKKKKGKHVQRQKDQKDATTV